MSSCTRNALWYSSSVAAVGSTASTSPPTTHRDAQRGSQRLPVAQRIVQDEVVEQLVVLEPMVEEPADLVVDERATVGHVATKLV